MMRLDIWPPAGQEQTIKPRRQCFRVVTFAQHRDQKRIRAGTEPDRLYIPVAYTMGRYGMDGILDKPGGNAHHGPGKGTIERHGSWLS